MGLKITGDKSLSQRLANDAAIASKGARLALKRGAEKIMKRSQENAPRLHVDQNEGPLGVLEEAHRVEPVKTNTRGRHGYDVYIDEDAPAPGNKTVGDYATIMHETEYNLGPESRRKPGNVGSKYLERAMLELEDEIKRDVENNVNKGVGH